MGASEGRTPGGWTARPLVWGLLLVLSLLFAASGVWVLIQREDDWVWDAVKAFGAAVLALGAGLGGRRRGARAG